MTLSPADDFFHEPANSERWWSETYWFSFDDPSTGLSGTFYPVVRRNLDIAALTVAVWSPDQSTPWTAPYYRTHWHLKAPRFDGNRMSLEGLRYEVLEPLNKYRVIYDDEGVFSADLTVTGLTENHVPRASHAAGHWDQPTRVEGQIVLGDHRIDLNCFGMRDRSWGPRPDDVTADASYVYGINEASSFLLVSVLHDGQLHSEGYIEVNGQRSAITSSTLTVKRDDQNRVTSAKIEATDALDRLIETNGTARNHIAKQASPGYFAWMSMFEWDFDGGATGQFQDVLSADLMSQAGVAKIFQ